MAPAFRGALRADALETVIEGDTATSLNAILGLAAWRGVAVSETPIHTGLPPHSIASAKDKVLEAGAREAANEMYGAATVEAARGLLEEAVDAFHESEPLRPGIAVELLRQSLPTSDEARLADLLLDEAASAGRIRVHEGLVARAGYEPSLTSRQLEFREALLTLYRQSSARDQYEWSRRLAEVAREHLRAGELKDVLKILADAVDLNLPPREGHDDGLASAAGGLHRRLAALDVDERFELLHKWSMPTETRRTIRVLTSIVPTVGPPSVFARVLGERPAPAGGSLRGP